MGIRNSRRKPAHVDFDSKVETRLVYDQKSGEFKEPSKREHWYIRMIPVPWISEAIKLPYSAVRVGLACWFLDGCNKQNPFTLSRATCQHFNINKWDKRRGIKLLENSGLIRVQRYPGRASRIEMVRPEVGRE
jgi:hypothetical protein